MTPNRTKTKVIVFPAGTEIGLEIARSLHGKKGVSLVGLNSVKIEAGNLYDSIEAIPFLGEEEMEILFLEKIHNIQADLIFPAHDDATVFLAELESEGKLTQGSVCSSSIETARIVRSKSATYQSLASLIRTPRVFHDPDSSDISFPLFAKPDAGQGSKGTRIVESYHDLKDALKEDLLVTEFLPGDEYTVDCFTDCKGVLSFCHARARKKCINGISSEIELSESQEHFEIASQINTHLTMRGPWFFQLKENSSGELVLMEVATRIAGSSGIHRYNGVNLALATVYDKLGFEINLPYRPSIKKTQRRLTDHIVSIPLPRGCVVDFDDTLCVDGRINWRLLYILGALSDKGVWIDVVSRHGATHKDSLQEALEALALPIPFRNISDIPLEEAKSNYTRGQSIYFIDDSYRERGEVSENSNATVFDVHEFISVFSTLV